MYYLAFVGSVVAINHLQNRRSKWLADAGILGFFAVVGALCFFHI